MRELFRDPRHPYTRGLLASMPGGARGSRLQAIQGTVPPIGQLPPGCAFAPRCPNRFEPCDVAPPGMTVMAPITDNRHPIPDAKDSEDIGHRTETPHEARCYLYSPAVDPETLPEERS